MTLQAADETTSAPLQPGPAPIWKEGYRLIRKNPRTMLPVLATQVPVSIAAAGAWLLLYLVAFPDVDVDAGTLFGSDAPRRLVLWAIIISWSHSLFTTVGIAGAVVAVQSAIEGRPPAVTASLDPPFTRLGGILVIFAIFQATLLAAALLVVTVVGAALVLFIGLRFGLVLHAFILDGLGLVPALRRSWTIMRGNVLRLIGTLGVVSAVMFVALLATTFVLVVVLVPFYSEDPSRNVSLLTNAGVFLALGAALVPAGTYFAATTTLLYRRIGGTRNDERPA